MHLARLAARLPLAAALAALLAPAQRAGAQQAAGEPSTCVRATGPDTGAPSGGPMLRPDTTHATLRILASVTADEVRFVGSPKICVRLTGDAQLDSVRVLARRNLASPVVSNTTYRNVYVAVEILGRLNAECIASRITGAPRDSARTRSSTACASLGVRGAGAAPAGPP